MAGRCCCERLRGYMSEVPVRLNRLLAFLKQDPGNLRLRNDAVIAAIEANQWSSAQQLLETALTLGVEPGQVRYNLAFALFMQRRYAEALSHLSTPSTSLELPLRARCLHHLQRIDEAIADCRAHLEIAPDSAESNGLLALLLFDTRDSNNARKHAEAALQVNPRQVEALLALASLQTEARKLEEARQTFETLVQVAPDCGRAWLGLALIELNAMRIETALRDITQAATHMPEHIGTWHVLAWVHLLAGDIAAAHAAFESALALDRNFGETHGGLAAIAALEGRDDEARTAIKRALRLDSQSLSARYAQMVLLHREGKNEQVQSVFDSVMERSAGDGVQYRDLVARQMQRVLH